MDITTTLTSQPKLNQKIFIERWNWCTVLLLKKRRYLNGKQNISRRRYARVS